MPDFISVIFDFDYTLADSSDGVVECVNYALKTMSCAPQPREHICQTIGLTLPQTFEALTSVNDDVLKEQFSQEFLYRADQVMVDLTYLYDGVEDMLVALGDQGLNLGIVSTKYRYRIEQILVREGIIDLFDKIVGGEDVDFHKPDPAGMLLAMGWLGMYPSKTIYVGDSVVDAQTAKNSHVSFIAVLTGATSREALEPYFPYRIFPDVTGIPPFLENVLNE
jgi:phosphoglycolate phosphatase